MREFTFVPGDSRPAASRSREVSRLVRSHVAHASHPAVVKSNVEEIRRSSIGQRQFLVLQWPREERGGSGRVVDEASASATPTASDDPSEDFVDGRSSDTLQHLRQPADPIVSKQRLLKEECAPFLVDYFLRNLAVNIPDLDLDTPGLLRTLWFPFVLSSPVLLTTTFLLSANHFINFGSEESDRSSLILRKVDEYRHAALQGIRRLLSVEDSTTDEVIAAITKLASVESIYGSEEVFDTHMRGLRLVVNNRGGLQTLGLHGFLARMICWTDYNAACLRQKIVYFNEMAEVLPMPLKFAPGFYIGNGQQ